ncbi:DegQ family serine endoprotease [Suttonella ornithocola]|uniref:Probable periplasmic serine endoprotease DegP-like n=1 Tax=Suttonella ornithocola TaxID=279832 RepID=A0A380N0K3_9GAMM|nr:DegQ family serine endoprotease [Suttonella ornithocola]SUO97277.1 Probable periplasmic serine endoprotease DegP-like precursor [Suttonella ornithocola]
MHKSLVVLALGASILFHSNAFADAVPDFTVLFKKTSPAVVSVEVESVLKTPSGQYGIPPSVLEEFFGIPRGQFQEYGQGDKERIVQAGGSGFIIDSTGDILTNAHVVDGADTVRVQLNNRKEYMAKVIGVDKRTDIALLKIDGENFPVATLGNSDEVQVGDWVLAIGSPFGFTETATKGIVSALGRSLPNGAYTPFIQTDAAINPGNSGGPLFNSRGEVIGINSQIYSRSGAFNGVGFAIPINVAKNIAEQLKNGGQVIRGWLGVSIQGTNQQLAESFGLDKPEGALVSQVMKGSPAEKAGIRQGDVILSYNNKVITKSADLPPLVALTAIGEKAKVEILRDGKRQMLEVEIGNLDDSGYARLAEKSNQFRGMQLKALDEAARTALDFDGEGVLVSKVEPKSAAAKSGLRAGDIIIAVGNEVVKAPKAVQKRLEKANKKRPQPILIYRDGQTMFIPLLPDDSK